MKSLRSPARRPTHPGAILRKDVLPALKMSAPELAERLGVSLHDVSNLLREKQQLTADMAMRLEKLFSTSAESWLRMQEAVTLWELRRDAAKWASIEPLGQRTLALED